MGYDELSDLLRLAFQLLTAFTAVFPGLRYNLFKLPLTLHDGFASVPFFSLQLSSPNLLCTPFTSLTKLVFNILVHICTPIHFL